MEFEEWRWNDSIMENKNREPMKMGKPQEEEILIELLFAIPTFSQMKVRGVKI
jgi:hypothetical protein